MRQTDFHRWGLMRRRQPHGNRFKPPAPAPERHRQKECEIQDGAGLRQRVQKRRRRVRTERGQHHKVQCEEHDQRFMKGRTVTDGFDRTAVEPRQKNRISNAPPITTTPQNLACVTAIAAKASAAPSAIASLCFKRRARSMPNALIAPSAAISTILNVSVVARSIE